jgi:hypothetical protein
MTGAARGGYAPRRSFVAGGATISNFTASRVLIPRALGSFSGVDCPSLTCARGFGSARLSG